MQIKSENFIVDSIFYRSLCLLNIEWSQFETYHSISLGLLLRKPSTTTSAKVIVYDPFQSAVKIRLF